GAWPAGRRPFRHPPSRARSPFGHGAGPPGFRRRRAPARGLVRAGGPGGRLILDAEARGRRVHVTGVGKCEYVAGYIASSYSSTGTPAFFLHATEAGPGASGQVAEGDVVIAISNS